jgi:MFS family permease
MLALLAQVPGILIGGKLADHLGRKAILTGAQTMSALFVLSGAFVPNLHWLPWLLIGSSVFNGAVKPATNALAADLTDNSNRRTAFSLSYLGNNVGAAIGPMIAGFLFREHMQWLFIGDALTTLIAVTLVRIMVREDFHPGVNTAAATEEAHPDERAESGHFWQVMGRRPFLTGMILLLTIYEFVYSQHSFTLPLDLNRKFGAAGPACFGTLMMTNALLVISCTTMIIWLTRRMQPLQCVALAGLFYGGGFGMYLFTKDIPWLIAATIVWSIGEVLSATNIGVYIACHAPVSHRARFNALFSFCLGAGNCLGPALMGQYIAGHGISAVWPLSLLLAWGAAGLMFSIGFLEDKRCHE